MEHRVAAWESMPWEAGGRGGCRAWRKDERHVRLRLGRCGFVWADDICNAGFVWADVTAKKDSPPLVESRPVTGP